MQQHWDPTKFGRIFTSSEPWSLLLEGERLTLRANAKTTNSEVVVPESLTVRSGLIWATVTFRDANGHQHRVGGIPNAKARRLKRAVALIVASIRRRAQTAALSKRFQSAREEVCQWVAGVKAACSAQMRQRGWLSEEFKLRQMATRPSELATVLQDPEAMGFLRAEHTDVQTEIAFWKQPFLAVADEVNRRQLSRELEESSDFFDSVERSPLTKEQAEAVICFDNRVLLVASAGSGKTSTMVAKAAYALKKNYFSPDKILVLAFNGLAALELGKRFKTRLTPLGLPAERVVAKTFHAFGLDVIGGTSGRRPSVARWLEDGKELDALREMVDNLKDTDPRFRAQWDMFRLIFGRDLPEFGAEDRNPEAWDQRKGRGGFPTLNNEVVKSRGEQLICNWLFYNGVRYEYETPYRVETADARHRQYLPDFFLPDADAYLEHWALDANGEPPPEFSRYKEEMVWKKALHETHGTRLLETTMADLWSGRAFFYLERELTRLGISLDPNPDRPVLGLPPLDSPRLLRTIRSFLAHAKSNRLSVEDLRRRVRGGTAGQFRYRHEMFLDIFEKVWQRWEARLRSERAVDFEDMLIYAAECIEQGRWQSPYELIMVDEFQDVSYARARLLTALTAKPDTHLFAVGDDWQSINRFAGADISVMTSFEDLFGKAVTMKLETTFRCPQSLCDISSGFVQKNPRQLRKIVRSAKSDGVPDPVRIIRVQSEYDIRFAIEASIAKIMRSRTKADGKVSVLVLGRYHRDAEHLPRRIDPNLVDLKFLTVHGSKGMEADHIFLPRMSSETQGFPSQVPDDPVLQLAMPNGDLHEFAEERRLFYVALTRARQSVTLVTITGKESAFVAELVRDRQIKVQGVDGAESDSEICPRCNTGFLMSKNGRFGPYSMCSNKSRCNYKRNADVRAQHQASNANARPRSR